MSALRKPKDQSHYLSVRVYDGKKTMSPAAASVHRKQVAKVMARVLEKKK